MARLRWKKHPKETGLRSVGSGPRGSDYHDGETDFATVYAHSKRHTGKTGWYWVSVVGGFIVNTCDREIPTEQQAKDEAAAHVRQMLAKARHQGEKHGSSD